MNLLIVESPSKSSKIQKWLGPGWIVAASIGHIRDLPAKELGVSVPGYNPTYVVPIDKAPNVSKLRGLVQRADKVFLATDPDREGEAISWHLMKELGVKSPLRVTFQEVTERAVKEAIARPRDIDMKLVAAQEARRVLDRLVGYQASPVARHLINVDRASAGRVQTPSVRLICDREIAITEFRETKHFGARAWFGNGKWSAEWNSKSWLSDGEQYLLDRTLAQRAASLCNFTVHDSKTKPALRQPRAALNTSTLLQAASASLGLSTAKTQQAAQKLFEGGHITYHRTDSVNLSDETIIELRGFAEREGLPVAPKARKWPSKEGAQEAHEAIRPTHWEVSEAGDDADQRRVYELIRRRAIGSQLAAAEYSETSNTLHARDGEDTFIFIAKGRVLIKAGFLQLTSGNEEEDEDAAKAEDEDGQVPALTPGKTITSDRNEVLEKATKPPPRFTEASLVQTLEREGVGRPSTYAAIIKKIIDSGYIEPRKKLLHPTQKGMDLIRALKGKFSFVEIDYTRTVEIRLDHIAQGKDKYREVVSSLNEVLLSEIAGTGYKPRDRSVPSEKQLDFAKSIAQRAGIELPAETAASSEAISAFIDAHAIPSPKAVDFAQSIATRLGLQLPPDVTTSARACSNFIDKHKTAGSHPPMKDNPNIALGKRGARSAGTKPSGAKRSSRSTTRK